MPTFRNTRNWRIYFGQTWKVRQARLCCLSRREMGIWHQKPAGWSCCWHAGLNKAGSDTEIEAIWFWIAWFQRWLCWWIWWTTKEKKIGSLPVWKKELESWISCPLGIDKKLQRTPWHIWMSIWRTTHVADCCEFETNLDHLINVPFWNKFG